MAQTGWLRTFLAAYQSGSVTEAARLRHLSQPSATAHIRSLEAAAGVPLFIRRRNGVEPTEAGRRLYAEVADPLDRLGAVLAGLDGGKLLVPPAPLRIGSSPEILSGLLVPHLTTLGTPVRAAVGSDDALQRQFDQGELDALITATPPNRRGLVVATVGAYEYALVTPPDTPLEVRSLDRLGGDLRGQPWISFSSDLPRTRRFWKHHFGRPFDADLRLVAPDLRVILAAVEAGVGMSLLPTLVAQPAIDRHSVTELFDVRHLVDRRPLWIVLRSHTAEVPEARALLAALSAVPTPLSG